MWPQTNNELSCSWQWLPSQSHNKERNTTEKQVVFSFVHFFIFYFSTLCIGVENAASINALNIFFSGFGLGFIAGGDHRLFIMRSRDWTQLSVEVPTESGQEPWAHCTVGNVPALPPSLFNSIMLFLCWGAATEIQMAGWMDGWTRHGMHSIKLIKQPFKVHRDVSYID